MRVMVVVMRIAESRMLGNERVWSYVISGISWILACVCSGGQSGLSGEEKYNRLFSTANTLEFSKDILKIRFLLLKAFTKWKMFQSKILQFWDQSSYQSIHRAIDVNQELYFCIVLNPVCGLGRSRFHWINHNIKTAHYVWPTISSTLWSPDKVSLCLSLQTLLSVVILLGTPTLMYVCQLCLLLLSKC